MGLPVFRDTLWQYKHNILYPYNSYKWLWDTRILAKQSKIDNRLGVRMAWSTWWAACGSRARASASSRSSPDRHLWTFGLRSGSCTGPAQRDETLNRLSTQQTSLYDQYILDTYLYIRVCTRIKAIRLVVSDGRWGGDICHLRKGIPQ